VALRRLSDEEKQEREDRKQLEAAQAAQAADQARREKLKQQFLASPPGRAREAFERGDQVFQYELDLRQTQAMVIPMVGAYSVPKSTTDPTDILNAVANEGWEIVNSGFVFVQTGSESRDKFMASGQQIAVRGTVVGYYLFKRCESNRRDTLNPWDAPAQELVATNGS
jgi:hypothetical protein